MRLPPYVIMLCSSVLSYGLGEPAGENVAAGVVVLLALRPWGLLLLRLLRRFVWTGVPLVLLPVWMFSSSYTAGASGSRSSTCRPPASWDICCGCVHTSQDSS